jgi:hypothetical protein
MQLADEFLNKPASTNPAEGTADVPYPLVIEPWVCAPPDIVVYEFGARLDAGCQAAASEQIEKATRNASSALTVVPTMIATSTPPAAPGVGRTTAWKLGCIHLELPRKVRAAALKEARRFARGSHHTSRALAQCQDGP